MSKRILALDIGATGGRVMIAAYDGKKLKLQEIHRFPNEPVLCTGHLYWDILRLLHEIKSGLRKANAIGGFDSIGINAWEKDYGLLDKRGALLANPFHYADKRTVGIEEEARSFLSEDAMPLLSVQRNTKDGTMFQLLEQEMHTPDLLKQAQAFLPISDLIAYLLTGDISTERTIADTTQLFDSATGGWCWKRIQQLKLPEHIFPTVMETGKQKGLLSEEICNELGIPAVPVIAVCGNGTQCAATAVPAANGIPFAFISCGAYSRFGTEITKPLSNDVLASANLSMEAGFGDTMMLHKNLMGLRMMQEIRRIMIRRGKTYSYSEFEKLAMQAEPAVRFIDTDAPAFSSVGDIPARIRAWCIESGQPEPSDVAEVLRCIYESLACKFRDTLDEMHCFTDKQFGCIYMLGGSKDMLLCQLTADVCGIPVYTGPAEAAAYGNAAMQLIADGELPDMQTARNVIAASITMKEYTPNPQNAFIYENYRKVFHS